jgi:hypothetical protein
MRRPAPFHRLPFLLAAILLCAAGPALALTETLEVTPDYLGQHSRELSLKVTRRADGLLEFTIERTVPGQRLFGARLLLKRGGRTLAETSIPSYGRKGANSFSFALSPEMLAESEFELEEADLVGRREGRIGYHFRLRDFVPRDLLSHRRSSFSLSKGLRARDRER